MGVWIETLDFSFEATYQGSHPVWVCGLKLMFLLFYFKCCESHPVWVCGLKLTKTSKSSSLQRSHPVWVCGLKQSYLYGIERNIESHPVWVCGLKHQMIGLHPDTGSHTLYGCVD